MITNVIFLDVVATRQECPFWPTDDCIQGRKKTENITMTGSII